MAQLWYSPISINAAQVPSPQTDFPVLINVTDARFKTTGNGGHVANSSGFDIRPYTSTSLGTPITGYELERYNAGTGEVVMWVKVSALSSSTTPIVLGYGDTSIITDGSSATTWSNSFQQVFHFKDGTSLNLVDSLATITLTNNGSATAAAGQIDGGVGLVSTSSQFLSGAINLTAAATYSAWVRATSFPNAYNTVHILNDSNSNYIGILVKSTGKLAMLIGIGGADKSYDGTGTNTLSAGTWYYLTLVYSNAGGLIGYVNAASDGTHAGGTNMTALSTQLYRVGADPVNASRFWNGVLDEVRVSTVVRAPDWITTEYNNQFSPGTFETLGAEVNLAPITGLFGIRTVFTRALTIDHLQVPSTQTDFPVLVSFTDSTFKTVANGGHVQSTNAFTFSSDSGGSSLLKWEVERYNASTGEIVAWVKIASVSSVSDTIFYLRYGSTITTDQSDPTNVWTSSYLGVYHFADGSILNVNSSTGSNNGTNHSATATTGQVDGAAAFVAASSQYVDCGSGMNPSGITLSAWVNATSFANAYEGIVARVGGPNNYAALYVKSNGKLGCFVFRLVAGDSHYDGTGTNTLSTSTWYYLSMTYDSSTGLIGYVNGASDGTSGGTQGLVTTAATTNIGQDPGNAGRFWNGSIDEARISSVARSANWIAIEYANQKPSANLVSLGSET